MPLEVAQQLLEQRDQLVSEVQAARRKNDRIHTELERAQTERDEMKRRVESAEDEARALRHKLAQEQPAPADDESAAEDGDKRSDGESKSGSTIELLNDRIEKLNADLERMRRRTAESVAAARRKEQVRLLSGLGEVVDSVERALEMGEPEGPWRQGLEGIRGQLYAFLRGEGATLSGQVGEAMDPNIHQAIATVKSKDFETGQIVRVDRVGIVLADGDTVVRPAQVVVAT